MSDEKMDEDSSFQKPTYKDLNKLSKSERDRLIEKFYSIDGDEDAAMKKGGESVDKRLL